MVYLSLEFNTFSYEKNNFKVHWFDVAAAAATATAIATATIDVGWHRNVCSFQNSLSLSSHKFDSNRYTFVDSFIAAE